MAGYPRRRGLKQVRLHSGDTLRALMRQRGYSMAQLGTRVGCSKAFIHGLCSGLKHSCSPQLGARIAEALDAPVDLLFAVSPEKINGRKINQNLIPLTGVSRVAHGRAREKSER